MEMAPETDELKPPANAYTLPVAGDRPVRVSLTARRIYVTADNGGLLLDCQRTVECAEEIADQLSAQRLVAEAEALRKEAARWRW